MSLVKGINLSTGFDLNAKSPLDNRQVFETIAERDALPDINRYEGLFCYVKETQKNYQFINGTWKDFMATSSGGSSEGTTTDVPTKLSQLENDVGFISEIPSEVVTEDELGDYVKETDLSDYATKQYVDEATSTIDAYTLRGYHIWVGTQAEYNVIYPKNSTTIYMIKEDS